MGTPQVPAVLAPPSVTKSTLRHCSETLLHRRALEQGCPVPAVVGIWQLRSTSSHSRPVLHSSEKLHAAPTAPLAAQRSRLLQVRLV